MKTCFLLLLLSSVSLGQDFQVNVHEDQYPGSIHKIYGWAGEPRHEEPSRDDNGDEVDDQTQTYWQGQPFVPPANVQSADEMNIQCRDGEIDIIVIQVMIDGKPDIVARHAGEGGEINWNGVAGENDNQHDHWPNAFGIVHVQDFNREEGDVFIVTGHTVSNGRSSLGGDDDQFGPLDNVLTRRIYSQQGGGGGAHDEDTLGYVQFHGATEDTEAPGAQTIHSNVGICATLAEFDAFTALYEEIEAEYTAVENENQFQEIIDFLDQFGITLTDEELDLFFGYMFD